METNRESKSSRSRIIIMILLLLITISAVGITIFTLTQDHSQPTIAPDYAPQQVDSNADKMEETDESKLEAEEGGGGDAHAEGGDPAGAQPPGQPVAAKAGDDGAGGDDHGDDPHVGHRDPQLPVYGGPGGAQQGVRQTQADEGQVDDGKKKMDHSAFPPWPQWGGFFAVPAGRNAAGFASGTSAALL